MRPFFRVGVHHAIHDEQESEARVGQGRGEGRRVGQTPQSTLVKEMALEMKNDAGETYENGEPSDQIAEIFPGGRPAVTGSEGDEQNDWRRSREEQRNVLRLIAELVDGVREEDVEGEEADVRDHEHFDPKLRTKPPAGNGARHGILRFA